MGVKIRVGNAASPSASANALKLRDLKESILFDGGMTKMSALYVYGDGGALLPKDMEAMEHLSQCLVPKWFFQLQNLMELTLTGGTDSSNAHFTSLKSLHLYRNENQNFTEFPNDSRELWAFLKLEEDPSIGIFSHSTMRMQCQNSSVWETDSAASENRKKLKEVEVGRNSGTTLQVNEHMRQAWKKSEAWKAEKE